MTWTVVGQDPAIAILGAAVKNGRVAHAYLFAGPAHVGKTLVAMQFAQRLNCTGNDAPCGACRGCEKIASGAHPDVERMGVGSLCDEQGHDHAKDNSRDIRICQVRRVEQVISRAPYEGRYRVIIIEPADALNNASIAALLKTLEEPPANVVFVLVSDHEELLLDTIRSRARRVRFAGQARDQIDMVLRTRWGAEPAHSAELARISGGRLGWAVAALRDEKLMETRAETLAKVEGLAQAPLTERFSAANSMGSGYSRDRAGTQAVLDLWQEWWRDLMLVAAGREEQAVNQDRLDTLRGLAVQCGVPPSVRALRAIGDARQQLVENASPVLALESMMLALPVLRSNAVTTRLRG